MNGITDRNPEAGLIDLVTSAADDDPTLDDDSRLLLLSVPTGDEELEAGLNGATRASARPAMSADVTSQAAGASLKSIKVAGFHGIDPEAKIGFHRINRQLAWSTRWFPALNQRGAPPSVTGLSR